MSAARRDLSRTVFGLRFQNPVLLAAGTAGFGRELDGVMDLDRLGGIVTKAVSREPRTGNRPRASRSSAAGCSTRWGSPIPGSTRFAPSQLPVARGERLRRARILVNVVGFTVEEYAEVVAGLDGVARHRRLRAQSLLSQHQRRAASSSAPTRRACDASSRSAGRAPGCRSSPSSRRSCPTSRGMAVVARDAGADGITVVNTLPGLLLHERRSRPGSATATAG